MTTIGRVTSRARRRLTMGGPAGEFWRDVLLAGGFTAIPRWTRDPVPGVAEHEAPHPR